MAHAARPVEAGAIVLPTPIVHTAPVVAAGISVRHLIRGRSLIDRRRVHVGVRVPRSPRGLAAGHGAEGAGDGQVIRAEAHAGDKFAAFDLAFGKLTERLRRAADKRKVHHGRHASPGTAELTATDFASLDVIPVDLQVLLGQGEAETDIDEPDELGQSPIVIRRKAFKDEPMTVDEALSRMELVGHDFYLFHDSETDKASVVYRRKGWNYGVITLN